MEEEDIISSFTHLATRNLIDHAGIIKLLEV